ncbi:cobalt-precorrin 4 C11-methyltransferase [Hydrogenispora ethanolica]|uniref:Cobalt-precorrin 4 C11-methyltransferase n=1 Tax=Hydrogenispora ethanolica TaxID=1082276 RepID=A0A4R1S497_HYDET|nr:precorrin-4 C(11)-methyltransferase [Hydrogenispora ethanolica]TCL74073.1 cobalt-precorrin 4 C11-methyltransferase [Hydrogenispora ethanolica]
MKPVYPVYIVGAGPGDPELLTVKAQRLLAEADRIIWAGSLVNPALRRIAKPEAEWLDSAAMTLEEIIVAIREGWERGQRVVRLHSGDPSLYGAIGEQMRRLDEAGIPYELIPGVSSFLAAAAALQLEYTVPEATQTVIITRMAGATPVPDRERLAELARHRSSICIFLSIQQIEQVAAELASVLPPATAVAVVEKASWPEQRIIRGSLADIGAKVKAAGIQKTALVIVGPCLEREGTRSKLYDGEFSHEYRRSRQDG